MPGDQAAWREREWERRNSEPVGKKKEPEVTFDSEELRPR